MGTETMSPEPLTDGVSKGLFPQLPRQMRGCCVPCRGPLPARSCPTESRGSRTSMSGAVAAVAQYGVRESHGQPHGEKVLGALVDRLQHRDAPVNPILVPQRLPPWQWWAGRVWQRR